MSTWIDCKKQKPELNQVVLVRTAVARNLYIARYRGNCQFENISCFYCYEMMTPEKYFPVEYWMSIPDTSCSCGCQKQEKFERF